MASGPSKSSRQITDVSKVNLVTIEVLPAAIRRRIAAGEVIERPASIAKELIENAIDAGARAIAIEVRNGGFSLIRVADDGSGMCRADATLALERFSTSKIHSLEDLERIRTLGFRGEALSSIAAVAQVEILTRAGGELEGTRVRIADDGKGAQPTVEPAASPVGTSVTVRGLFAHLPARRRFLKSRTRETELIQQTAARYALAYPQIAFRLLVDGRERLVAPQSTLLVRIGAVMGHDVADEMIPISWQALDLQVQGYISRPTIGRSRRDGQHFFANGRPIRAGLLAVMLERPYAGRLPPGRYPLAVIHVTIDPYHIDVNVHPRKEEIRFSQERTVYGAVSSAVRDALSDYPLQAEWAGQTGMEWPFGGIEAGPANEIGETPIPYTPGRLRVLAQLHNTYILAQTADGLIIVDQHAAHEQVLFEQLARSGDRISLSPPARLGLTRREVDALNRIAPLLNDLGIEIEPFGGQTFLIRTLPTVLRGQDPCALVTALIEEEGRCRGSEDEQRDRLAMKAACLAAIKAGDPLSPEHMQRLIDDLAQAWSPAVCPHGRPALVSISMEELGRRFGRM
jgi:DNA mismatch repair protein MutL